MQITHYFLKKLNEDEDYSKLSIEWINEVYRCPQFRVRQSNGRIALYGKINQGNVPSKIDQETTSDTVIYTNKQSKYLRVELLKDGKTVRDAFFDSRFHPSQLKALEFKRFS
uniref:hypothetical protein n=1 Tax=Ningiella ruwaisensis TaxID=2364274 RepID=UPI0019D623D4|nr:hypothetical protein [Ningiella ruwaisensis]